MRRCSAVHQAAHSVRAYVTFAMILCAMALAPAFGIPAFIKSLIIEILTFSILAMSLNILVGYTGLVSFGHAAFFAVAGYALALFATKVTPELLISFPIAVAAAALVALPIGWLCIRLSGFYFLMITFAFAQMVYTAAFQWKSFTGGSDGLLAPAPTLIGKTILQDPTSYYFFTLILFGLSVAGMYAIIFSQFGRTLQGIRENTMRMRALGYNVRLYKLSAFIIAASFAGLGGAANVLFNFVHCTGICPLDAICAHACHGSHRWKWFLHWADCWNSSCDPSPALVEFPY